MSTKETFFTSDTHFCHRNSIYHSNRPYESVEEMNEGLIKSWNDIIKPKDEVYHLGDVTWRPQTCNEILSRLNGKKHLILGNHDKRIVKYKPKFESIQQNLDINIGGYHVFLSHFPHLSWDRSHHGSINLHGHCHGTLFNFGVKRLDVGVDANNYRPISWDEVIAKMKDREEETEYYNHIMSWAIKSFKEERKRLDEEKRNAGPVGPGEVVQRVVPAVKVNDAGDALKQNRPGSDNGCSG